MALLRAKTKAKKAELESRSAAAEARRAAQDSAAAVRDLAQALLTQLKQLGIDEKTGDAVQRFKSSEAYGKAAAKASEISKLMADSEAVAARREAASQKTTAALTGLGTWLATGDRGQKLGITQQRRRRSVSWLFGLLGIGIGYAAGILTAPKQGREIREQLTSRASSSSGGGGMDNVGHIGQGWDGATPPAERPLTEKVRTRLGEDPRTSDLPSLDVDIVGGTVVVRGTVPQGRDQGTIRDVILSVEGVDDVDLRLDSNI
jgi:BON domain